MRAFKPSLTLALLLCLLASNAAPRVAAGDRPHTTDPCRIAVSSVLDPVSAYFASLDRATVQAFNGHTTCLSDLTSGGEQARGQQQARVARATHVGATLRLRSAVATADVVGDPESTNCATIQATVMQDMAYVQPGKPQHHTVTVRRYILQNTAPPPASNAPPGSVTPVYVATGSQPISQGPLPDGAAGPFAGALAGAVNRYLLHFSDNPNHEVLATPHVRALAQNGFVIDGRSGQYNFFGVEGQDDDAYAVNMESSVPSFVTPDAGLHTFHVLFDRTLMTAESVSLRPRLSALLTDLLRANTAQRARLTAPAALTANGANAVYLAVPLRLLGGMEPSDSLSDARASLVARETALVQAHSGEALSPFLGQKLDYQLFKPRGHYTDGPELDNVACN